MSGGIDFNHEEASDALSRPDRPPAPLTARRCAAIVLGAAVAALSLTRAWATTAPSAAPGAPAAETPRGGSTTAGERRRPVLENVRELDKPVTYTETKIPLGELIEKVAADTGAPLTAAPGVADEPVEVIVNDLPARELLEQLADLLDYQWARHGKEGAWRYEIWQDVAGKQREEALRQAALAAVEQRLREQIAQYVEVAALPPAEIQRRVQEYDRLRKQFFDLPYPQRMLAGPQVRQQLDRLWPAQRLASPVNRVLAGLLGRLSPSQWNTLRSGQPLLLSSDPQPGELLLPEAMLRAFRTARPSMDTGMRTGDPVEAEKDRQRQRDREAQWAAASGYQIKIRLDASRFHRNGMLSLEARAAPLPAGGAPPANPVIQSEAFDRPEGATLELSAEPVEPAEKEQEGTPERNAALEQDPVLGARKVLKLDPKPGARSGARASKDWWTVREMLPDVARTYGVSMIADAYEADGGSFGAPGAAPLALYLFLDRYAGYSYRWDRRDKLVRLRSRNWFFARPKEVPMRLLRRWGEMLDRQGALPLEEFVRAAAALNDAQLESADQLLQTLAEHAKQPFGPQLYPPRYALRFYASLTPGQQQALWRGRPVAAAGVPPALRALFLVALNERESSRDPEAPAAARLEVLPPEARFSLTQQSLVRVVERGADSTTIYTEPAPAAPAAAPAPADRPRPGGPPPAVSRTPITDLTFEFFGSPELREAVTLSVASPR